MAREAHLPVANDIDSLDSSSGCNLDDQLPEQPDFTKQKRTAMPWL